MKRNLVSKIFGIALVFVMVASMFGGLVSIKDSLDVEASVGDPVSYTVYATREGCVGGTTANGHVIVSHDHFVALPSTKVLCSNGGHEYEVKVTYEGKSVIAPVWDVGPWNTKDNYWDPSSQREMWQDLPQGKPEAQAAYQDGYNGGFDETNYLVEASTGSDEFSVGDRVRPTVDGLSVRSSPGGDKIGSVSKSDTGTVIDGPEKAVLNGLYYRWWKIEWDKGLCNWSAQKRYVSNPAGIDLADGTFWDDLGMTDNDWVTVEYLWTTAEDNTPPTVDAFDVTPSSVTLGNPFTISYTVSDTGGSGLKQVELWRANDIGGVPDWGEYPIDNPKDVTPLSGQTSYSGSFSDAPPSVGSYWYGLHVVDNAGNWAPEDSPIEVEVIKANNPPQLSNGYVAPSSGTPSTDFYYYVTYFDPDGDSPSVKQVIIDGTAYTMSPYLYEDSWIIYRYGPKNLSAGGTHYYFFYFEDGRGGWARLPTGIDMYLGPSVSSETYPPTVTTEGASSITTISATLTGNLDSTGGETCQVWFEYGTSTSYGSSTSKLSMSSAGPFCAIISSLSSDTTYHFRACASNSKGTRYGSDMTFNTEKETYPPQVTTEGASSITTSSATLTGNLDSTGGETCQVWFEYGTTTSYGSSTSKLPMSSTGPFCAIISSLSPDTTYHFRACASNSKGTKYGSAMTFNTEKETYPPTVTTVGASSVTTTSAALNGHLDDLGSASSVDVSFQWGETSAYGKETDTVTMTEAGPFCAILRDLLPDTTYYFRAKAVGDGISYGVDKSFITTSGEVVTFPDQNLEAAIREAIGKPTGDIYQSDLEALTYFYASNKNIADLSGLEYCINVETLGLYGNNVTDLSPISDLTGLWYLQLSNNQISDLSPLSNLTNLWSLDIWSNHISDLSPISKLNNLHGLDLFGNEISDLLPLSDLVHLENLLLGSNQISDLSPILSLTNLKRLDLSYNPISNPALISNMTNLQGLKLNSNEISDISFISDLTNLKWLSFSLNQISDLSPLSNLTSLIELGLGHNQISDISTLSGLDELRVLYLDDNEIADITPLSGLSKLGEAEDAWWLSQEEGKYIHLGLRNNQISDLSPLAQNAGLGEGDGTDLRDNPLSADSLNIHIPALVSRGVNVLYDAQKTWYVDDDRVDYPDADFTKIQDAVDAANPGDTIIVYPGTYTENVDVNKDHLTIKSQNGAEVTIVQQLIGGHIFKVTAAYVEISGFTIEGATRGGDVAGIFLEADHCKISNNDISDNNYGIHLYRSRDNNLINNTFVNDGLYVNAAYHSTVENNTVNGKPLVYLEDTAGHIIQDAGQVILVNCDNITVENLDLSNATVGVQLVGTTNTRIRNITASNNWEHDIRLKNSNNNSITGNIIGNATSWSEFGIHLENSNNNTVSGNTVNSNRYGIFLSYSSSNKIMNNTFLNNGLYVYASYHNTVENNTVNGKPVVYLEDTTNYIIEDAGQVILVNCENISVENLDLSNATVGVELLGTTNSKIMNVTASSNVYGVYLRSSSNNALMNNTMNDNYYDGITLWDSSNNLVHNNTMNNNMWGIMLYSSSDNKIYLNNFMDNLVNSVCFEPSTNTWNSPEEITYTYNSNTYTNYLGNYWSDYPRSDADGDGIGDTPYSIDSDADSYPLVEPFENYETTVFPYGPFPYGYKFANGAATQNIDLLPWIEVVEGLTEDDKRIIFEETFDWSQLADLVMKEMLFSEFKDKIGKGGNCYGMVASSLMEYVHADYDRVLEKQDADYLWNLNTPWAWPLGIWDGRNMQEKPILKHILKFQLSQYGISAQEEARDFNKDPMQMVQELEEEGKNYIIGVAYCEIVKQQPEWRAHALTPYEVKEDGDKIKVYVYDPNWPDKDGDMEKNDEDKAYDRYIEIDKDQNSWRYLFNADYWPSKSATISALVLIPIEAHYYYTYDGTPKPGGRLTGYPGPGYCLADGNVSLTLTDSEGRTTGFQDSSFVGEIPGVKPIYDFFTSSGKWGQAYYVSNDTRLMATIEGVDGGTYSVTKFGSDYFADVSNVSTSEGVVDNVTLSADGAGLSFSKDQEPKTYDLVLHVSIDGGNQTFTASNIPAAPGVNHEYSVNWSALAEGEEGVTIQVDSDGDGDFENTFTADGELTQDEFLNETIPQLLKQDAISKLEAMEPNKNIAQYLINSSIRSVNKSLSDRLWIDDSHLNSKIMAGPLVFDMERGAVLRLEAAERINPTIEDEVGEVIDKLTKADKLLSIIAIDDAKGIMVENPWKKEIVDRQITKAEEEQDKAYEYLDKDMPARAITHFKLAWIYAQVATKVAQPTGAASPA